MRRAAIFDDPQAPGRQVVDDAMIEQDHAVRHILLDAVARKAAVAALRRDDGGELAVLEPAEQPPQLGAKHGFVGDAGKQRVDAVEDDAPRAYARHREVEPHEQPFEIVFAGLVHLLPIQVHIVGGQQFAGLQVGQIEAQRRYVDAEIGDAFVERHEHPGFAMIDGAPDKKGGRQQRLAASRATAHQRGPARGKAASGQLVEPLDAAGGLFQMFDHRPALRIVR